MNQIMNVMATTVITTVLFPTIALTQTIPKTLKQGMPYAQARKTLINTVRYYPNP